LVVTFCFLEVNHCGTLGISDSQINNEWMKIVILNGPNLNLLGVREKSIYGDKSFLGFFEELKALFPQVELEYFQSNVEGELINKIHQVGFEVDGIIFNAGAYTHTSVALADAVSAVTTPVIEVHISNVFKREAFRHHSYLSPVCRGSIVGFGLNSYRLAIEAFLL
jgi:3-dehydroquinate dehydratase-2